MEDRTITAAELRDALAGDLDGLFEELAEAMNAAQPGRIIADSEEPVRDAHAEFRQRAYQKPVELLQARVLGTPYLIRLLLLWPRLLGQQVAAEQFADMFHEWPLSQRPTRILALAHRRSQLGVVAVLQQP